MKIVHVIHSVAGKVGGPSVTVPTLCRELSSLDHQVQLHVTDTERPNTSLNGVALIHHPCLPAGKRLGLSPALHRSLLRESKTADIIHSHGLWLAPNLDVHWATRSGTAKLVLSPRGMLEPYALRRNGLAKRIIWMLGQGAAVRAATCIHVTSEAECASVRALGLRNPVAIVPNGVALPALEPKPKAERRKLLFLGRLDHKKGIDFLLRAWASLAADFPDWDLDITGPGSESYVAEMRALRERVGAVRVSFSEPVFGTERDRLLLRADLFVLPTRSENFGMTVAESLAAGVPVVCSRGAPWSRLDSEGCGWWVEVGVPALTHALRKAMALSDEQRAAMGARGRAWMEREFSWRAQAMRLASTYRWLLTGGPSPAWVSL